MTTPATYFLAAFTGGAILQFKEIVPDYELMTKISFFLAGYTLSCVCGDIARNF